jgi:hypothetical protein
LTKVEPDQVTIYPIAIDRVPDRRDWRVPKAGEAFSHNPQFVPSVPLDPFLIEPPIVINSSNVRAEVTTATKALIARAA